VDDAVPNSIVIRAGRGVLITGSNMSGKSTFLRTVGVNAILAQTISTALAREYRAPVFHVRSSIGRADDLLGGKSYYLVEVETLLELVRASNDARPHPHRNPRHRPCTSASSRLPSDSTVLAERSPLTASKALRFWGAVVLKMARV
jgi:energy-coupling factor transporter ATP-binding protein EcfA2